MPMIPLDAGTSRTALPGEADEEYQWAEDDVGRQAVKITGYPFPGEVRAVFTNRAGETRLVVEATGRDYVGMLHIFNPAQVEPFPRDQGSPPYGEL